MAGGSSFDYYVLECILYRTHIHSLFPPSFSLPLWLRNPFSTSNSLPQFGHPVLSGPSGLPAWVQVTMLTPMVAGGVVFPGLFLLSKNTLQRLPQLRWGEADAVIVSAR